MKICRLAYIEINYSFSAQTLDASALEIHSSNLPNDTRIIYDQLKSTRIKVIITNCVFVHNSCWWDRIRRAMDTGMLKWSSL